MIIIWLSHHVFVDVVVDAVNKRRSFQKKKIHRKQSRITDPHDCFFKLSKLYGQLSGDWPAIEAPEEERQGLA